MEGRMGIKMLDDIIAVGLILFFMLMVGFGLDKLRIDCKERKE